MSFTFVIVILTYCVSVVPDFLVQTGDRTGTGGGGESFYGGEGLFMSVKLQLT